MSDAIKLAIEALESCTDGDYSTGHVINPDFDRAMVEAALAALRAQPVPEVGFGNITQPAAPFKKLSDDEVLWIARSHGIDVYASNPLAFYADLISTTPAQPDHSELVDPRSLSDYEIKAIAVCGEAGHVSVSRVQRHLKIGYNLANTLCESIIDLGQVDGLEVAPSLCDARNKRLAAIGETME